MEAQQSSTQPAAAAEPRPAGQQPASAPAQSSQQYQQQQPYQIPRKGVSEARKQQLADARARRKTPAQREEELKQKILATIQAGNSGQTPQPRAPVSDPRDQGRPDDEDLDVEEKLPLRKRGNGARGRDSSPIRYARFSRAEFESFLDAGFTRRDERRRKAKEERETLRKELLAEENARRSAAASAAAAKRRARQEEGPEEQDESQGGDPAAQQVQEFFRYV